MTARTMVIMSVMIGVLIGVMLLSRGPRDSLRPGPRSPLPAPESLGVVMPRETGRPPQQQKTPETPAGKTSRGLTPPPEEMQRLDRDGAVLY